jgi:hypothetical protein
MEKGSSSPLLLSFLGVRVNIDLPSKLAEVLGCFLGLKLAEVLGCFLGLKLPEVLSFFLGLKLTGLTMPTLLGTTEASESE